MTKRIVSLLCAFCIVFTSVFCGSTFTAGAAESTQENYYEVSDKWTSISRMTVSGNTLKSDIDSGWTKAVNHTSITADKNFIFETRVSYVSGSNHQYFVYFGLPSDSDTTGGFSLRIQLGDTAGTSNIAVYNDATNKRASAWKAMPESSDRTNFALGLSYIDGKLTVKVDKTDVIETTLSGYQGGYLGIATFKTKAEFQGLTLRMEKEQSVTKVYLANEDFSSFAVEEHGTAVNGNLSVISSESTRAAIREENGNKYLSMSRSGVKKAENCLLQFQDAHLSEDTYVIQFDARLDENVPLQGKANLLVGRKATASGAKFEYFVNVSQAGYLYCTTGALGSTTFGRLGSDRFSNIAVVIHDAARTYDVYLNGLPAVMGQGFANSGYAGIPSETPTLYRIALGELATDSALLIDNFKVYTGSQVDDAVEADRTIVQQFDNDFEKLSYIDSRGTKLNYRMYLPDDYDPAKKYPMVLAMHGAGLWGSDNTSQLMNCFHLGVSVWQNRDKYGESIILVPQTAEKVSWVTGNGTYPWFEEGSHNYSMEVFTRRRSRRCSGTMKLCGNRCPICSKSCRRWWSF